MTLRYPPRAVGRRTSLFGRGGDEAIKLGDRICLLRQGGRLAQYDTPEAILADPADDFVADFVGADRGLKRLARRVIDVELLYGCPPSSGQPTTKWLDLA